jgi:hypothetical protein
MSAGHLDAGAFITKFRKIFMRNEMNDGGWHAL